MLKLQKNLFGTDQNGNEVFMCKGDTISEISDAGPIEKMVILDAWEGVARWNGDPERIVEGWHVTVRFTPSHKQWDDLVTVDAVKLLRALEE